MNKDRLASKLRDRADSMDLNCLGPGLSESEEQELRDNAELVRVLARVVEGMTLEKAFGAPGDWGYGTPIGDALAG